MAETTTAAPEAKTVTTETKPGDVSVQSTPAKPKAEAKGEQTPPTKAETAKEEAKTAEAVRKFKLMVNGAVRELDEKTVLMLAQKGMGADDKFQQAAKMRKQAEDLVTYAKSNLPEFMRQLQMDPYEWAENLIMDRMKLEKLTPEQRELMETKKKLATIEEEKRKIEETERDKALQLQSEKLQVDLTAKIVEQLDKSGLPKTPRTVARMAHFMLEGLKNGVRFQPADVVDLVWDDYVREHQEMYDALPQEKLMQIFSEAVRKKMREAELGALKNPAPKVSQAEQPPRKEGEEKPKQKKFMTTEEFREMNRRILEGEE